MGIAQKQVSYCTEVDSLLAIVVSVVKDVKEGKAPAVVLGDVMPYLVKALAGVGELKTESLALKELEVTVAMKLAELVAVLTA